MFHQYPVKLYKYPDGIYVQSAAAPYAELVGGKLVRIGTATADRVYAGVSELVGRDNEMTIAGRAPALMTSPEVLRALGLSERDDHASFSVEHEGKVVPLNVKRSDQSAASKWVDARDSATAPTPRWLEDPATNYWFEYLDDSRTMYVQYNAVQNKPDESVEDFFGRLFVAVKDRPVDRMVIDLRRNGGGDGTLNWPLIYGIIRSDRINQRGRLFVIIGRRTFSAAQNCVNALEKHTPAIFVGEPTGAAPNSYGNAVGFTLPNSKLEFFVSTYFWQDVYPWDNRRFTAPEITAELTADDYKNNVDPALVAILRYRPIYGPMVAAIDSGDVAGAIARYRAYRTDPANAAVDTEIEVGLVADLLMKRHRTSDAIEIYKLNAADHPTSYTAYQSLALAYFALGNRDLARAALQQSLRLNPTNSNTVTALRMLGAAPGR